MIRFTIMAFPKSPEQDICYTCGDDEHMEHFCPYNHIYGRYGSDSDTCRGGHRITCKKERKFLRCFIRMSNLSPGFREWDLKDLFGPFGALLMWDVPRFDNEICGCTTEIRMSFGYLVFKKREDGERAINELNGFEVMGRKLRVDWVLLSILGVFPFLVNG
ncbi:hypothetical protein HU200_007059 [Digitaria exilis]|uniref:RRM domain-containing protein n=1 Tax=Digitaria exilis TaxID=1010633 RepID=A0A835KSV5_9POAL|nr:hypothetical protein HU200_007059 [Digitaria exilis]